MPGRADWAELARLQAERLHRWRHVRRPSLHDDRKLAGLVSRTPLDAGAITDHVVDYLWHAHRQAALPHGTIAYYAGAPSIYGARSDGIEGVTRLLPLWAVAVAADAGASLRSAAMREQLQRAIVHGCDPRHPSHWGAIEDRSTLICEAADVALALWLSREWLWERLTAREQSAIATWLAGAVGKRTADNNWHLFVVFADAVLAALAPGHRFCSHDRLQRVLEFRRPDGCFVDGPAGRVDYYNAWGFHYLLFWLGEVSPAVAPADAPAMLDAFCHWYRYLFADGGVPLFGRSLCYRLAVSAPLLAGALRGVGTVDAATARRAYSESLQLFVREGALRAGRPTQGVFGEDVRWLDAYSGPASSLWGTRSLVLYLHGRATFDAAVDVAGMLPAERDAVRLRVEGLGAELTTDPLRRETTLRFDTPPARAGSPGTMTIGMRDRLRQWAYAQASRRTLDVLEVTRGMSSSRLDLFRNASPAVRTRAQDEKP